MSRRTLTLTADQRSELVAGRDHDARPYFRERCGALLMIADGRSAAHVAQHRLLRQRDPDTVYRWLNRYERSGITGLVQHPRGHRGFSPSAAH